MTVPDIQLNNGTYGNEREVGEAIRRSGVDRSEVFIETKEGRSAIPRSTNPAGIAENFDVLDFELTTDELTAVDALDTGVRRGPEPDAITLEAFGREIQEA